MPTIQEGKHYPGWDIHLPWVGSQRMTRYVRFHEDCQYESSDYNSQDVNKLFGLSFGVGGVHDNSARFGWRWSKADQCIELLAYVYKEGTRNWDEQLRFPVVMQVKPGQVVRCDIETVYVKAGELNTPYYTFIASVGEEPFQAVYVPRPDSLPRYGLTHGLYFGGDLVAPHQMTVDISQSPL